MFYCLNPHQIPIKSLFFCEEADFFLPLRFHARGIGPPDGMAIEDFGIPMDYQPNLGFSQHELRETAVYGWFKREHHATPMGLYGIYPDIFQSHMEL